MIAPSLVIFIVALTTRRLMRLVRNGDLLKSGVTYAGHEPFMRTRSGTARLSAKRRKNLLHREPTLIELLTTLRGATSQVQKGRHNMQYIDEHGCLTQRSQLERLRELADGTARQRVKALAPTELLPTTVFVVDPDGKESIWDLDHLAVAGSSSSSGSAVQLLLDPELALDNLVPTHAIMRILRDTAASAVAVMAPVNASSAALHLADFDP